MVIDLLNFSPRNSKKVKRGPLIKYKYRSHYPAPKPQRERSMYIKQATAYRRHTQRNPKTGTEVLEQMSKVRPPRSFFSSLVKIISVCHFDRTFLTNCQIFSLYDRRSVDEALSR